MSESLTGKRRHRVVKPWLSKAVCILQVEVRGVWPTGHDGHDTPWTGQERIYWRDATPEDLTTTSKPAQAINQVGYIADDAEMRLLLETLDKLQKPETNGSLFVIMVEYRKKTRIDAVHRYLEAVQ